jgi:iron complex transport system permease protein
MDSPVVLVVACFVGALLSSLLLLSLSRRLSSEHGQILLAGIAMTTLASAVLAWIYVIAPPQQSKTLTFWLLGSFAQSDWSQLIWVGVLVSVCSIRLLRHAHALNQLMVGESIAITHGVEVAKLRRECVVLCALIVGACVAISGSIAFVGLLVPHFVRRIWGADNRLVMPLSMAIGVLFMGGVVVLNQALSIIALPVSLVTASIGAPVFVYVLLKHRVAG